MRLADGVSTRRLRNTGRGKQGSGREIDLEIVRVQIMDRVLAFGVMVLGQTSAEGSRDWHRELVRFVRTRPLY